MMVHNCIMWIIGEYLVCAHEINLWCNSFALQEWTGVFGCKKFENSCHISAPVIICRDKEKIREYGL